MLPSECPMPSVTEPLPSVDKQSIPGGSTDQVEPEAVGEVQDDDRLSDQAIDFLCSVDRPPAPRLVNRDRVCNLIGQCGSCQPKLPWPAPIAGYSASPVTCPKCGRWYYTLGSSETVPGLTIPQPSRKVQLLDTLRAFLAPRQSESQQEIFVSLLGSERHLGPERRRSVRRACSSPVVVVPLDEEGGSIGEAVAQTLLDISEGGVGMIGNEPIEAELLLIDFSQAGARGVQALARKAWTRSQDGFTKTGCEFLVPLGAEIPLG